MTQCITNVFLCKSPSWALHRVHNHISTGGPDRKGSQERHSQRRIQLLVHRNYFAVSLIKPVNFWGNRSYTAIRSKQNKAWLMKTSVVICVASSPNSSPHHQTPRPTLTAGLCPSLSRQRPKVRSGAVVNPTGLTNWLLSSLRGLNLSDLTDSARAMKRYSAHRLNT